MSANAVVYYGVAGMTVFDRNHRVVSHWCVGMHHFQVREEAGDIALTLSASLEILSKSRKRYSLRTYVQALRMGFKRVCSRAGCLLGLLIVPMCVCSSLLNHYLSAGTVLSLAETLLQAYSVTRSSSLPGKLLICIYCAHPCLLLSMKNYSHLCPLQHAF